MDICQGMRSVEENTIENIHSPDHVVRKHGVGFGPAQEKQASCNP